MKQDILNYIKFLSSEYGISISIHNGLKTTTNVINSLTPYNIHRNPYCLFITSDYDRHKNCMEFQKRIRKQCEKNAFCATCMCGVKQYIIPITYDIELLGFICVGGYKDNLKLAADYAEENGISSKKIIEKYNKHLKDETPDINMIQTLTKPLCAMLAILFKQTPNHDYKTEDNLYLQILSVIHAKAYKKLTISDIAQACYCSESFVSRVFKKNTGKTVSNYITYLRMKKAIKLLEETDLSITDIAYECGFNDSNYFIYSFNKFYGVSPNKYRKQL